MDTPSADDLKAAHPELVKDPWNERLTGWLVSTCVGIALVAVCLAVAGGCIALLVYMWRAVA